MKLGGDVRMRLTTAAALVIGGLSIFSTVPANATILVFDWSLTGPATSLGGLPFPGSGTLTVDTSMTVGNGDKITGITGTIDGSAINGLSTFQSADNLFFINGTSPLDLNGLGFTTAQGQSVVIRSQFPEGTPPTGNAYQELTSSPGGFGVGTFAATATPLPAALPLFAGGLGFVGYLTRRKQRTQAVAA
jgi:hypothetical protein